MPTLLADLRYGVRMLASTPRVTLAALCSLGLGIGATTAIFTVVNAVILRPLPYRAPEQLVAAWETSPDNDRRWVAPANFLDWRREAGAFAQLAAWDRYSVNLTGRDRPERLRAASVSGSFFQMLGAGAALGRAFSEADDAAGAEPVAMLTHGAWQRLYAGDSNALGRTLVLDGTAYALVGVLPRAFDFFGPDVEVVTSADRGIPRSLALVPGDITQNRDVHMLYVVGRLRSSASMEQAEAELRAVMRRLEQAYPATNSRLGARVIPLHQDIVAESRTALLLLLAAVGCLLLIACANVANLMLARAVARRREMAIRISLGAGRVRLIRQVLTETLVLGIAGGLLGIVLATWGVEGLLKLAPEVLPRTGQIRIDSTVLLAAAILSIGTALAFGIAPALHATNPGPGHPLQAGSTRASEGRRHRRAQHVLVVAELTLGQVLLAGAGVLIASFVNLRGVDLGFNPEGLLAVELTMPAGKYSDPERKLAFHHAVLERMERLPGVRSAAATLSMPLRGAINRGVWFSDRPAPPPGQQPNIDFQIVSPGYFRTMGIPVLAGRTFTDFDTFESPRVALISQAAARRYWPAGNAVGQRIRFGRKEAEVIGIVGDVRQRDPARAPEPLLYTALQQDDEFWNFMTFALRTAGDPAAIVSGARDAVLAVDPDQPVARIRTLEEIAGTLLAGRRFHTVLLAVFSGIALLLAAIGTYGVIAYAVARRTREIGVRMAVGARPRDVMQMVLREGGRLIVLGIALGTSGAMLTNRLLSQQLFEVGPMDPAALAAGAGTLGALALAACCIPALRAMRIQPIEALREE